MAKKSGNLLALITGVAAGAAAVFFAKQENRVKATKVAKKTTAQAKKLNEEYKADPKAFKKKVKAKATKVVKKAVAKKTTTKKVASKSPAKKTK